MVHLTNKSKPLNKRATGGVGNFVTANKAKSTISGVFVGRLQNHQWYLPLKRQLIALKLSWLLRNEGLHAAFNVFGAH
jgi:hypothetical protein